MENLDMLWVTSSIENINQQIAQLEAQRRHYEAVGHVIVAQMVEESIHGPAEV